MTHRSLVTLVWRYRVAGLMVILGITFLLVLIGTHLVQHLR